MTQPTGISRRVDAAVRHLQAGNCESALVDLFPAIDKTAKKRRPKANVGARIRGFFEDEEALLSAVATGTTLSGITVDGLSLPNALYKFGRTPIAREGELDPRLQFDDSGGLEIGPQRWNLPSNYIAGMCIAVIVASENRGERAGEDLAVKVFGHQLRINDIWGDKRKIQQIVCEAFAKPDLFEAR